jgi:hypothetical protein
VGSLRRIPTSDVLGTLLAVASWILVALIALTFLRVLMSCGWGCLD